MIQIHQYWTYFCRYEGVYSDNHLRCTGYWHRTAEDGQQGDLARCVCPCHNGFNPYTGTRYDPDYA